MSGKEQIAARYGKAVRERRRNTTLKQDIFAEKIGVSRGKLSAIENGKAEQIDLIMLEKLCGGNHNKMSDLLAEISDSSANIPLTDSEDPLIQKLVRIVPSIAQYIEQEEVLGNFVVFLGRFINSESAASLSAEQLGEVNEVYLELVEKVTQLYSPQNT